jgi:hypothetical protein
MLVLNPRQVSLGEETLEDVGAVVIDRRAEKLVVEWSDFGAHAVYADVAEQRIVVRIVQEVVRADVGGPAPGDEVELAFHTSPTAGDVGRRKVSMTVVVTGVSHELSRKRGAVRTIEAVAISSDGATDPVTIEPAEGGSQ